MPLALLEDPCSFYPDLLSVVAAVASPMPGPLSDFFDAQASPATITQRQAEKGSGPVVGPGLLA